MRNLCEIVQLITMLQVHSLFMQPRLISRAWFAKQWPRQVSSTTQVYASTDRISAGSESLDTLYITEHYNTVVSHLTARRVSQELLHNVSLIPALRAERGQLVVERDAELNTRKTLSQQIGTLMRGGADKQLEVDDMKRRVEAAVISAEATGVRLEEVEQRIDQLFRMVPNLLDDRVPEGADDQANTLLREWGTEKRKLAEGEVQYKWHDELAVGLGGLDSEAAARMSGTRFSVLRGSVARLERAIGQYFLDFHLSRGYEEVSVPLIVSRSTLQGTGQLPKFEEDLFRVSHSVGGEDAFLIPTAEVPLTNLLRDRLMEAAQLPARVAALTPCFRAEAGSSGRDTRGLLRQHQFLKVELVRVCSPETSDIEHEAMLGDVEALLQSLELPYRVMVLCAGDIGFSARLCYDIETWLPGQQAYREISSISNCGDFQSRRMGLRYRPAVTAAAVGEKDKKTKKLSTVHPHTLNGSGVAVGRALVAVLENFQQPDGSIWIPPPLRPYMGGLEILSPPSNK